MKLLIQAIVFVVCYCLNAYAAPFFEDLGYALGILVFGDQDGAAMMCGLLSGALAILVYGVGFVVAKRINERRLDGSLKYAPGIKRMIFALPMLLADAAITDAAVLQAPFFGSGDFVVPASGAQLFHDLLFLSTFHWMGVLGLASLIRGLIAFCRQPVYSKFAESVTATPSKSKTRFCKLCGDPIDPVTRKCTGCRKQYFRLPVFTGKHYFIAATAVACVLAAVLLVMLISQRSTYETQVAELTARVSELESELAARELTISANAETIDELKQDNSNMRAEIRFYDNHVVFIGDDGTKKYHNYDCPYLDLSYFWAYNTEAAVDRGYKPCSHCCG